MTKRQARRKLVMGFIKNGLNNAEVAEALNSAGETTGRGASWNEANVYSFLYKNKFLIKTYQPRVAKPPTLSPETKAFAELVMTTDTLTTEQKISMIKVLK